MNLPIFTVKEINKHIKQMFAMDQVLSKVKIKGEISNLKLHSNGHIYFSLKDSYSKIDSIIFYNKRRLMDFNLTDGVEVIATGNISTYEKIGTYQFYVDEISLSGVGTLFQKYEKLKLKLQNKGIFDSKYKQTLPYLPNTIGIITSITGAVLKDILNVLYRRFPKINVIIVPVKVQGFDSSQQIIEGIKELNKKKLVDLIIIARGGGSIEELWSFNDEKLAYEIFKSNLPIISAVGHETDFTICDFVADKRAPTPSAAAEISVPEYNHLIKSLKKQKKQIYNSFYNKIFNEKEKLKTLKKRINISMSNHVKYRKSKIKIISNIIIKNYKNNIILKKTKLHRIIDKLNSNNPVNNLKKGYSLTRKLNINNIVSDVNQIEKGDKVEILLKNGIFIAKVIDKQKGGVNNWMKKN